MKVFTNLYLILLAIFVCPILQGQIVINEGSNKNYSSIADEDDDHPDWIELYNGGSDPVDLFNYSLTDNPAEPDQWILPHFILEPGAFQVIFCSGKNRFQTPAATLVSNTIEFNPTTGWNTHAFTTPFMWDGFSNIVINTCSYSSLGYITNSIFNQSTTPFVSSTFAYADGSPDACSFETGEIASLRPNMRLNETIIGTGTNQNCNTCYPAPYGNWYWGARNQILILSSELLAAGLTAGPIDSLAFDIAATDNVVYDYIEIQMNGTFTNSMSNFFINQQGDLFHTNFRISSQGESVYLFAPDQTLADSLNIQLDTQDLSKGSIPDGDPNAYLIQTPTPGTTNNANIPLNNYAIKPIISIASGFFTAPFNVTLSNPNGINSQIYYSLDGSYPDQNTLHYDGESIYVYQSTVIRARSFDPNLVASDVAVATYFMNVNHITPILSVTTDNVNLYGPTGNFDNPLNDWMKSAYVEYFDSISSHPLLFSQNCGMIQDGGWGGSRTNPQRSFRIEMTNGVLGGDPMEYDVIPSRPNRHEYSDFYLRNGSNQYLALPYKDAAQVKMMGGETHNYYSAWRPISVYINGQYFGLYELREKFNKEKFAIEDNATKSTIEILSVSAFYGGILRAVEGDVNNYVSDYLAYLSIDPASENYWEQADQYFDMKYYTDYIIGESWIGNVDWPWNNIKIYRSDATDNRWRFCLIDMELSLLPNSWTDCSYDHIQYMLDIGTSNPYLSMWNIGMNNPRYYNYFINRFADVMNTSYESSHLIQIENSFFNQTVVEMPKEFQRWAEPWNVPAWMDYFYNNHLIFQSELACRTEQVRNHLQNDLNLDSQVEITLNVSPSDAGRIVLNTITPGELPWTGIYFNGVPVTMTAIPNPGYSFDHWLSENIITSPMNDSSLVVDVYMNDLFTAYFSGSAQPTNITISEINYHSDSTQNSGDWIELHNYGNAAVDLSGWRISNDDTQPTFEIPMGTVLYPLQYLVLVKDAAAFHAKYPNVSNYIGSLPFSLTNGGDGIRLYNYFNNVYLSVDYSISVPWPMIANGAGRTLELGNVSGNLNDAANWFAGCMFGSPGEAFHSCTENIVFSEINYASAPNANSGDWIEIRNIGDIITDISGWKFRDGSNNNVFQIPQQTILAAGEMIVLSSDVNLFDQHFPGVTNRIGDIGFSLDNSGETVRLYNDLDKLYFSMYFSSDAPWPTEVNASGYTLELADSSGNFNDAGNWFAGCLHGSPGNYYAWCEVVQVEETSATQNEIHFYPNPTNGEINVTLNSQWGPKTSVQIFDALGREVTTWKSERSQNNFRIQLDMLASGWYFIRVVDGEKAIRSRVLKN